MRLLIFLSLFLSATTFLGFSQSAGYSARLDSLILTNEYVSLQNSDLLSELKSLENSSDNDRIKKQYILGKYYYAIGKFDSSVYYYNTIVLNEDHNLVVNDYELFLAMGDAYSLNFQNRNALDYYSKALEISKGNDSCDDLVKSYVKLGEYFRKLRSYVIADAYIDSAFVSCDTSIVSSKIVALTLNRKAAILNETGNIADAISTSELAIKYAKKAKDYNVLSVSLNELGYLLFYSKPRYALDLIIEASQIRSDKGMLRDLASSLTNLAYFHNEMNNTDSSLYYLDSCERLCEDRNWIKIELGIAGLHENIAIKEGDYKTAYEWSKIYTSKFNEDERKAWIKEVEAISKKYDLTIALEEAENAKTLAALKKQQADKKDKLLSQMYILMLLLAIMLIIAFVSAIVLGKRRRVIAKQAKLIVEKNKDLNEVIEYKNVLSRELHHRVKNNLQVIISLLSMQSRGVKDENTKKVLQDSSNRVMAIALIHEKLYAKEMDSKMSVPNYIQSLVDHLDKVYKSEELGVKSSIEIDDINLPLDMSIDIGLVLNELLTNSYKYAFEQGKDNYISIQLHKKKDVIHIVIIDSGPGIEGGINNKNASSLGLRLISSIIQKLNGSIHYSNEEDSRFEINIPLS